MNYDQSKDSGRENKGYNSKYSYETVKRERNVSIASQPYREAEEKRNRERAIRIINEKNRTEQLILLGRLCGYAEVIDEIPLDEQKIMPVDKIENPKETESFQYGYTRGKYLAKNGLPIEAYHEQLEKYEKTYGSHGKNR